MKQSILTFLLLSFISLSCDRIHITGFTLDWDDLPDEVWAGPDIWANRLQDWKIEDGRLVCVGRGPMRTAHLTTRTISDKKGNISASLKVFRNPGSKINSNSSAGFLVGAGRNLDRLSAFLIFHSWGESAGIYIGLDSKGNLFIRDFEKENAFLKHNNKNSR